MKKTPKSPKLKKQRKAVKLPRPKLPIRRAKPAEQKVSEALSNVPRITNDTVAEHREEVLSSARKYIYPLQHSKHSIVRISVSLLAVVVLTFLVACTLALYKFQSTGGFIYGVTQVLPFPVAKVGSHWISYESYLFELRRNMHYYVTQQQADFSSKTGKAQLRRLKEQAMTAVEQAAYVKQLAAEHHVTISDQAVNNEVTLLRAENRLGNSDRVFSDVLNQFWGWNETDFKRALKQQLLQQAVVAKLDTQTNQRAQAALQVLQKGADFATLASQQSDDVATKANGGQYPNAITPNAQDVPPAITNELFKLKAGQVSGVVNTGYTLDILKVIDTTPTSLHAAHIQFTLQQISTYTKSLQAKQPPHTYIKV